MSESNTSTSLFRHPISLFEQPANTGDVLADAEINERNRQILGALDEIEQMSSDDVVAKHLELSAKSQEEFLDEAIQLLPQRNIAAARNVLASFADHPSSQARWEASVFIHSLTPCDHDYAVTLWDQLIRDADEIVRDAAMETLDSAINGHPEGEAELEGLTWRDAYRLRESYLAAEDGEGLHDVNAPAPPHPEPEGA